MVWQHINVFCENYGDVLQLTGGTYISLIVSIFQWIIFVISLDKAMNLDTGSLSIQKNEDRRLFLATSSQSGFSKDCFIFNEQEEIKTALNELQGILEFSIVIGIMWAILVLLLILYLILDTTYQLFRIQQIQDKKSLYIDYFKFLLQTFSNSLFIIIYTIEYNSNCVVNYPQLHNIGFTIQGGFFFLVVCIIGNIFCWRKSENPHFCFTYSFQLACCRCCSSKKQPCKAISCCLHSIGFIIVIVFALPPLVFLDPLVMIVQFISMILDIIKTSIKYSKMKKNNYEPIKIKTKKSRKVQPTISGDSLADPERQPSQINTQD